MHNDDSPAYAPKVCLFHARGATNCCVWRTWAYTRTNESQSHRSACIAPLQFDDLKGAPGIELPNTVVTEISGGPPSYPAKPDTTGPSPKARKLLGWFRRASIDEPRRMSGPEEEDVGLNNEPPRASHSVETTNTGITVQYDIRRTVEELRSESSSQEGDCATCMDLTDHRKDGDM